MPNSSRLQPPQGELIRRLPDASFNLETIRNFVKTHAGTANDVRYDLRGKSMFTIRKLTLAACAVLSAAALHVQAQEATPQTPP